MLNDIIYNYDIIIHDSEVIMFSPGVFVWLCVSVYVSHDVCPDDLTTGATQTFCRYIVGDV